MISFHHLFLVEAETSSRPGTVIQAATVIAVTVIAVTVIAGNIRY
jgi:hypothetical protein